VVKMVWAVLRHRRGRKEAEHGGLTQCAS
jgi:hypothetical protein